MIQTKQLLRRNGRAQLAGHVWLKVMDVMVRKSESSAEEGFGASGAIMRLDPLSPKQAVWPEHDAGSWRTQARRSQRFHNFISTAPIHTSLNHSFTCFRPSVTLNRSSSSLLERMEDGKKSER